MPMGFSLMVVMIGVDIAGEGGGEGAFIMDCVIDFSK
jgi:hypothetical protein